MDNGTSPIDFFETLPGNAFADDEDILVQDEETENGEVVEEGNEEDKPIVGFSDTFEEVEEETSDEDESDDEDALYSDEEGGDDEPNLTYAFAMAYKEKGIFSEDTEIPEDITPEQLHQKLYDQVSSSFDPETYLESQGLSKEARELAKYIAGGMDPAMAHEGHRLARVASVPIEDNPDAIEHVLRFYYGQTMDQKNVERQIKGIFEDGEEFEEATRIQKELAQKSEAIFEKENTRRQELKEQNEKNKEAVLKAIQSEKFGDKPLSKREQKELIKYNYEITDFIEVDGKKKPVTGVQKDMWEIYSDPVKYARFSNIIRMFKDDFKELKNQAVVEAASSALDVFNSKSNKRNNKKKTSSSSKSSIFDDASFVGDFSI